MKRLDIVCVFIVIMVVCCNCGGGAESQVRQLREELKSEIRYQTNAVRDSCNKDIKEVDSNLQKEIDDVKETHRKDTVQIDKTLIDHQKQIFSNKTMLEDSARRVYLLESIITSKTPVVTQTKEGYVIFVKGSEVSISLGGMNGINEGDHFVVFKDSDKIGTIKIESVETNSSKGTILQSSGTISIGDKVEIEKNK